MSSKTASGIGKGIMHRIGDLLMGLAVVCTVMGLIFGTDPFNFLGMVVMISICLGGLPIIVLGVVSFFVGAIFNSLLFRRKKGDQESRQPSNEQAILIDYIASARANNLIREDITNKLIETGGWSREEVNSAYDLLDTSEKLNNQPGNVSRGPESNGNI